MELKLKFATDNVYGPTSTLQKVLPYIDKTMVQGLRNQLRLMHEKPEELEYILTMENHPSKVYTVRALVTIYINQMKVTQAFNLIGISVVNREPIRVAIDGKGLKQFLPSHQNPNPYK